MALRHIFIPGDPGTASDAEPQSLSRRAGA
jgi:hypothetical protein